MIEVIEVPSVCQLLSILIDDITSRIGGRGNVLGPVRVSVCLSVCLSESEVKGQDYEVKVTEANLLDMITVRCGEREVHQCWGIFISFREGLNLI